MLDKHFSWLWLRGRVLAIGSMVHDVDTRKGLVSQFGNRAAARALRRSGMSTVLQRAVYSC